ncbi:MAG: glycosyl hydrolase [Chloroflexi bacterium RBG_13_56_8]|nr:MAG: glycosyl hydrolase [Chloroflexi bacterium RBG_13_56_8]
MRKVAYALLAMQRHSWEQGTAAQAFLELGEEELEIVTAYEAVNRQTPDGRLGVTYGGTAITDPSANGEAVLYAAQRTDDAKLRAAAEKQLLWLLEKAPRTAEGTLHHTADAPQIWVDSFYMAPPFLAVAGYGAEAVRQIEGFRALLWDPEAKLFHHRWDDGTQTYLRAAFWGVGNGWAAAGLARVIAALPLSMSAERERLIGYAREVIDGCLVHLRSDGLFHDVVDDCASFVETNLAQMLSYTIFRGVTAGWLAASYLDKARRMREAAHSKVDAHGLVQGVCAAPAFDSPGFAPEGQAFFLLMEAAARDVGETPL